MGIHVVLSTDPQLLINKSWYLTCTSFSMELQTRPPHSRVLHIQAAAGEDSNYYEHVEWGPSNNEKLSQPPNETVNSEKTRSKSHIVLLSCVVFAVCLILALLIVVTVLLSLEFSASKYQREIQFLMVEVSEINKLTQNVTGSKFIFHYISISMYGEIYIT